MSTEEERIRLLFETRGQAELKGISAQMADLRRKIIDVDQSYQAGNLSAATHARVTTTLASRLADLKNQATAVSGSIRDVSTGVAKTAGNTKVASQAAIELGRGFEDFVVTGGQFRGVINNVNRGLELWAVNAGVSAAAMGGLGITTTLVGMGLDWVINHWSDITATFTGSTKRMEASLEGLNKHLKELGSKETKIAMDYEDITTTRYQIAELTKDIETFKKLSEIKTPVQAAVAASVGKTIEHDPGGKEFTDALKTQIANEMLKGDMEILNAGRQRENALKMRAEAEAQIRMAPGEDNAVFAEQKMRATQEIANADETIRRRHAEITMPGGDAEAKAGAILSGAAQGLEHSQDELIRRVSKIDPELAKRLEQDIANARAGLATQLEIEAEGRKNKIEIEKKLAAEKLRIADEARAKMLEDERHHEEENLRHFEAFKRQEAAIQAEAQAIRLKLVADAERDKNALAQGLKAPELRQQADEIANRALMRQAIKRGGFDRITPADRQEAMAEAAPEIIRAVRNSLIQAGMDPGAAAMMADKAPDFFLQQAQKEREAARAMNPGAFAGEKAQERRAAAKKAAVERRRAAIKALGDERKIKMDARQGLDMAPNKDAMDLQAKNTEALKELADALHNGKLQAVLA